MRSTLRSFLRLVIALVALGLDATAFAQPAAPSGAPPAAADDPRLPEAKEHFLRGVEHTDRGEWDAALAEFLKSREILPTAKNTYNAAVCLRHVSRFDEALDMYEALLHDFPSLAADERQVAERELLQLRTSVGAIELRGGVPGSTVVLDTRDRGTLPLAAPLRVAAGTHTVRVSHEGFLPFEARVDIVGLQTATVSVQLAVLTAGGRLHVAEQSGQTVDVVVDNAIVGKTPWDGVLPPGDHTVLLRGEGRVGTQPVLASVKLNQTVNLNLLVEDLDANLRVQPKPPSASVSIDGIPVGRGAWEGRLRAGTHAIEVTADGYLPFKREVTSKKDGTDAVEATLARDPSAFAEPSATLGIELDAAMPLGALWGGDLASTCNGSCSASLPVGLHGVLHGIYQTGSGFGGGVDLGYLLALRSLSARPEAIDPVGPPRLNPGTVDDKLRLAGLTLGASAQFHKGEQWPVLLRLGAGVLLGSLRDERAGSLTNSLSERYHVSLQKSATASFLYVAPEVRIGRRFGAHLELSVGTEILLMTALSKPKWNDAPGVLTTNVSGKQGDGVGTFGNDTLAGSFMVLVAPGLGARYDF
jgi:hypothetical protein